VDHDHGVGIEVGGSRSSVLSGRTQTFAHPPRIIITSTPAQDPSKWVRGRGHCDHREKIFFNGVINSPSKAKGQRRGNKVICPLDVEHVSAGTNYTSDASVAKTSGIVTTKPLLISALLRNVSQQGGHDEASASRGWLITRPASPPAGHPGTDSSVWGRGLREVGVPRTRIHSPRGRRRGLICLGKRVTGGGGTPHTDT